jgi:hypothetical protein
VHNEDEADAEMVILSVRLDNAHEDAEIVEDFWPG